MTGVQTCALPISFELLFPSHDTEEEMQAKIDELTAENSALKAEKLEMQNSVTTINSKLDVLIVKDNFVTNRQTPCAEPIHISLTLALDL